MNLTIVVLSIIILLLLREIYKNWSKIDDSVIRKNRNEMFLLAIQELEKGIIHSLRRNIKYKELWWTKFDYKNKTIISSLWAGYEGSEKWYFKYE